MSVQSWIAAFLLALALLAFISAVGLLAEYAGAYPGTYPGAEPEPRACRTDCRPMQAVLANRPIYPVHSFSRRFTICEWPR